VQPAGKRRCCRLDQPQRRGALVNPAPTDRSFPIAIVLHDSSSPTGEGATRGSGRGCGRTCAWASGGGSARSPRRGARGRRRREVTVAWVRLRCARFEGESSRRLVVAICRRWGRVRQCERGREGDGRWGARVARVYG
jgi:hypothetical protein